MNALTERQARRIAADGREALLARLRPVFERHAEARAERLTLDDGELDELVLRAAARADGALWRRALADVAMEWLDLDLAEAVHHPAVIRAHELAGAPAWTVPPALPGDGDDGDGGDGGGGGGGGGSGGGGEGGDREGTDREGTDGEGVGSEGRAAHDANGAGEVDNGAIAAWTLEARQPAGTGVDVDVDEDDDLPAERLPDLGPGEQAPAAESGAGLIDATGALRVPAIHIGGIETVKQGDRDIELRFSDAGMDVIKRSTGAPIGRLEWDEIKTIEMPKAKRGLRPGRRRGPELHVTTERGGASFELPGITDEQLREHLEPMLERARKVGGGRRRPR